MNQNNLHPNAQLLGRIYQAFSEKNFERVLQLLPENFSFQVAGKSKLAGKFSRANFVDGFAEKLLGLTQGSYEFQTHDVLASDLHGMVLGTIKLKLADKVVELRTVHVWRFENGKPIAGYEYARDLYLFDSIFGANT